MKAACFRVVVSGVVLAALVAFPVRSTAEIREEYCRDAPAGQEAPADCDGVKVCTLNVDVTMGPDGCQIRNIHPGAFINRNVRPGDPRDVDEKNPQQLKQALTDHQLQICQSDTVAWRFTNECDTTIEMMIDKFGVDDAIKGRWGEPTGIDATSEDRPNGPLDPGCTLRVSVPRGETATVRCSINASAKVAQTYKYDLVILNSAGQETSRLDPEFELYP